MMRFFSLLTIASILLLIDGLTGQQQAATEIPVVSEYVGATIDIPEQEYYQIFDKVKGFLSAQFQETDKGFKALIQTEKGWKGRFYTKREFYDLGLAIDLAGPIDPEVWVELSGQRAFEETVTRMANLPLDVRMILFLESGRVSRGVYRGFEGHHFLLEKRRKRNRIPLESVARIMYREHPVPDFKKDVRTYAIMAVLGMVLSEGWNYLTSADDFDTRWRIRFMGGVVGLCVSPFVVQRFRIMRAPAHWVGIPRETRTKIDTYTFITFN